MLKLLAGLIISILIVSCTKQTDQEQTAPPKQEKKRTLQLVFREIPYIPDSIYSPEMGADLEGVIEKFQEEHHYEWITNLAKHRQDYDPYNATNVFLRDTSITDLRSNLFSYNLNKIYKCVDANGVTWQLEEKRRSEADSVTYGRQWFYHSRWVFSRNNKLLYDFTAYSSTMPAYAIYTALIRGGEWIVCYQTSPPNRFDSDFHVVFNGQDLNELKGYDQCLAPVYCQGYLYYLFEKDGKWGWSFNGKDRADVWDRIDCHFGDGSLGFGNPHNFGFYALRDGMWYKVGGKIHWE